MRVKRAGGRHGEAYWQSKNRTRSGWPPEESRAEARDLNPNNASKFGSASSLPLTTIMSPPNKDDATLGPAPVTPGGTYAIDVSNTHR